MKYLKWLGLSLSLLCIYFLALAFEENWSNIKTNMPLNTAWPSILQALLAYLASYPAAVAAWLFILKMFNPAVKFPDIVGVHFMSQIGKYLPGNFAHHVGRVLLANNVGIPTGIGVKSLAIDMSVLLAAALLCSLPATSLLLSLMGDMEAPAATKLIAIGGVLAATIGIVLILVKYPGKVTDTLNFVRLMVYPKNTSRLLAALFMYCLCFVLGAAALLLLCNAFSQESRPLTIAVVGIYAAAWTAGFIIPGAPAGLGVRDAGLLLGLTQIWPQEASLAAVAALRIITTATDGLVFFLGYAISKTLKERD